MREQLAAARTALSDRARDAVTSARRASPDALRSPWMSPSDAAALSDAIVRAAEAQQQAASSLLCDVLAMECALAAHAPPHAVALLLPSRWLLLAKTAREEALSTEARLRVAIPPCGHRIARSYCFDCLRGMGLTPREPQRVLPRAPDPRR